MRWLLLVLALFSGVAYSRSGPHINADAQQGRSQAVQRGRDQFPVAVKMQYAYGLNGPSAAVTVEKPPHGSRIEIMT